MIITVFVRCKLNAQCMSYNLVLSAVFDTILLRAYRSILSDAWIRIVTEIMSSIFRLTSKYLGQILRPPICIGSICL